MRTETKQTISQPKGIFQIRDLHLTIIISKTQLEHLI